MPYFHTKKEKTISDDKDIKITGVDIGSGQ